MLCVSKSEGRSWRLDNLGLQIRTAASRGEGGADKGETMWLPLDSSVALSQMDGGGRRRALLDAAN